MRAVVQKVSRGSVKVDGEIVGKIGAGLVILLGVGEGDGEEDSIYLADKIAHLRIFEDDEGKMNLSVKDMSGEILSISQFTLYGDCRKGRRTSFSDAARPDEATKLYEHFNEQLRNHGLVVETGVFQTHMEVEIINDGPVTMLVDSKKEF